MSGHTCIVTTFLTKGTVVGAISSHTVTFTEPVQLKNLLLLDCDKTERKQPMDFQFILNVFIKEYFVFYIYFSKNTIYLRKIMQQVYLDPLFIFL